MTSETLIMNKDCIAMASDSAVTVGNFKTYTGANKLFMLSNDPPMGMMIYGSANFENILLETLISEFSKVANFKEKNDIISIKDDFLDFLGENTPSTDLYSKMESGFENFKRNITSEIEGSDIDDLMAFLDDIQIVLPSFLKDYEDVIDQFDDEFKQIIPDYIPSEFHDEIIIKLKNIYLNQIIRMGTGVVIAGFSEEDMYPSVVYFNIVLNNNKKIEITDYDELLNFSGSAIIPFAQEDVINTFLTGIDTEIERALIDYFDSFIHGYIDDLKDEVSNNNKIDNNALSEINNILDTFAKTSNKRIEDFKNNIVIIKETVCNPIVDSVAALPKEDLANMSEYLIKITSIKRKVDSNLETVGGDIDVAIISKIDGFIWMKHKNYFDEGLNPQFFDRK